MRRTALLLLAASALFADGRNKAHPDEVRGELTTAKHADFKPEDIVKGGTAVLPLLSDIDNFNPYLSTSR